MRRRLQDAPHLGPEWITRQLQHIVEHYSESVRIVAVLPDKDLGIALLSIRRECHFERARGRVKAKSLNSSGNCQRGRTGDYIHDIFSLDRAHRRRIAENRPGIVLLFAVPPARAGEPVSYTHLTLPTN